MMRRWLMGLVIPAFVSLYACGGAQTAPSGGDGAGDSAGNGAGDVCPVLDPGPPPVCPEGCVWDGETCRKHSGIIMPDARDGGAPTPVPSPSPLPTSRTSN